MEHNSAPEKPTTPMPPVTSNNGPQPLHGVMSDVCARLLSRPAPPSMTVEEYDAIREHERQQKRRQRETILLDAIGKRYADCTLTGFEIGKDEATQKRQNAVQRCLKLAGHLGEHIAQGGNVVICGPPGTGKDHLMVGLLRLAIQHDATIEWRNGQELYRSFRDQIDSDRSEASLVASFARSDILAISDPVPPKGNASDYAAHMLYQIVDGRYRSMKSVWVTANVASSEEAKAALSAPILDRLIDNAFVLFCNWPSYRQSRKPEWMRGEVR